MSHSSGSSARTPKQAAQAKHRAASKRDLKRLLIIPLVAVFPIGFYCMLQTMENMSARHKLAPTDYPYPSLLDLATTSLFTMIVLAARIITVKHLFTPLGRYVLPTCEEKKNWTPASREDRVERFAVVSFKLVYFVCLTSYGYRLLLDTNWLPPELGGRGDINNCWEGFPFAPIVPGLKLYFDTAHTYITFGIYLVLLATWGYTRLYVFPFVVIQHIRDTIITPPAGFVPDEYDARPALLYMLYILQALHIYWYILFLIMGYTFLASGKTVDIQQNPGAVEEARAAQIRQAIGKAKSPKQTAAERIGSDEEEDEDVTSNGETQEVTLNGHDDLRRRKDALKNGNGNEKNGKAKKRS